MEKIEYVKGKNGELLAIVVRSQYRIEGSHFITEESAIQNFGFLKYNKGDRVKAHYHPEIKREIYGTPEVVIIRSGKIKLTIFDNDQVLAKEFVLAKDDIFLLISGGHAEEFCDDTSLIVVKQGPYAGENDKVHFEE